MPVLPRHIVPSLLQVDNILGHLSGTAALDEVCRFLGAELPQFVNLAVYRWQGGQLQRATSGQEPLAAPESIAPNRGAAGRAVAEQRSIVLPDLAAEGSEGKFSDEGRCQVAAPIRAGGAVVGVLLAESRLSGAFDVTDARFLDRVAERLGPPLAAAVGGPPGPAA